MDRKKHTPAPWVTDGGSHIQALYTPTDGGKPFYRTIARLDQPLVSPEQMGANTHLIAAAPDLYEALIEARPHIGVGYSGVQRYYITSKVDAALKKAKGEDIEVSKNTPIINKDDRKLSNTEILFFVLGYQGGTIHQLAEELNTSVSDIIDADYNRMQELCRIAQKVRNTREVIAK